MIITRKVWQKYIDGMAKVSNKAKEEAERFVETHDVDTEEGRQALIDFCYGLATKYGEASAEFACQMYDAISELEGANVEPAEPADTATYGEVAAAVNSTINYAMGAALVGAATYRLVKLAGQDTTLKNAIRDRAYYAWIVSGDTCAFCISIAAEGWKRATEKALSGGHAEHIHGNCDCAYAIKHEQETSYSSYTPERYQELFEEAEGDTQKDKINSLRRLAYKNNREKILEQKKTAYEKSKELNSSQAEEINVD